MKTRNARKAKPASRKKTISVVSPLHELVDAWKIVPREEQLRRLNALENPLNLLIHSKEDYKYISTMLQLDKALDFHLIYNASTLEGLLAIHSCIRTSLSHELTDEFLPRAASLVKSLDDITSTLRYLMHHQDQLKFLGQVFYYNSIFKFIHNIEDYYKIYLELAPYSSDHFAGLPLDFTKTDPLFHSYNGIIYSVPDVLGEREMYRRYFLTSDRYISGILPASIKTAEELGKVLSYVSANLYPNYLVWFQDMLRKKENLETVLLELNVARCDALLKLMSSGSIRMIYPNPESVKSTRDKLGASKANLLLARYEVPYYAKETDSLLLKTTSYLDRIIGDRVFAWPPETIDEKKLVNDINEIYNADKLASKLTGLLADSNCAEQLFVLKSIGRQLFLIVQNDEEYRNIRHQLPNGADLEQAFMQNSFDMAALITSIKLILMHNEKAISRERKSAIPDSLVASLKQGLNIIKNAADLEKLLLEFPDLQHTLLYCLGSRLNNLIQNQEDYHRIEKLCYELKNYMADNIKNAMELALLFNFASGDSLHRSDYLSLLKTSENLLVFFEIASQDQCEMFIHNHHGFIHDNFTRDALIDILETLSEDKGKSLFTLYNEYHPVQKSSLFSFFSSAPRTYQGPVYEEMDTITYDL